MSWRRVGALIGPDDYPYAPKFCEPCSRVCALRYRVKITRRAGGATNCAIHIGEYDSGQWGDYYHTVAKASSWKWKRTIGGVLTEVGDWTGTNYATTNGFITADGETCNVEPFDGPVGNEGRPSSCDTSPPGYGSCGRYDDPTVYTGSDEATEAEVVAKAVSEATETSAGWSTWLDDDDNPMPGGITSSDSRSQLAASFWYDKWELEIAGPFRPYMIRIEWKKLLAGVASYETSDHEVSASSGLVIEVPRFNKTAVSVHKTCLYLPL